MSEVLLDLNDPRYEECVWREVRVDHYRTSDGGFVGITHVPTGISQGMKNHDMGTGRRFHEARNAMIGQMFAEVRAKGYLPPAPKPGLKKIGKPRWPKVEGATAPHATNEDAVKQHGDH